jgi:two-component system, OmpR family, response regulator
MDGMMLLRLWREKHPGLLVLLLSAPGSSLDRTARFTAGDRWLDKPFSLDQVEVRIAAMLLPAGVRLQHKSAELTIGDLVLNEDTREVSRDGKDIPLSHNEFGDAAVPDAQCTKAWLLDNRSSGGSGRGIASTMPICHR